MVEERGDWNGTNKYQEKHQNLMNFVMMMLIFDDDDGVDANIHQINVRGGQRIKSL